MSDADCSQDCEVRIPGWVEGLGWGASVGWSTRYVDAYYYAITTLTTVGYGDIAPQTVLGQALASVIMIFGYGIIAVPTGIVGAEIAYNKKNSEISTQTCPQCSAEGHDIDAVYCKFCGSRV